MARSLLPGAGSKCQAAVARYPPGHSDSFMRLRANPGRTWSLVERSVVVGERAGQAR